MRVDKSATWGMVVPGLRSNLPPSPHSPRGAQRVDDAAARRRSKQKRGIAVRREIFSGPGLYCGGIPALYVAQGNCTALARPEMGILLRDGGSSSQGDCALKTRISILL